MAHRTTFVLTVFMTAMPLAGAFPVSGDCAASTLGVGVVDSGLGYWITDRDGGIWLWQESNAMHGLQQGNGSSILLPGDSVTCYDEASPDILIL